MPIIHPWFNLNLISLVCSYMYVHIRHNAILLYTVYILKNIHFHPIPFIQVFFFMYHKIEPNLIFFLSTYWDNFSFLPRGDLIKIDSFHLLVVDTYYSKKCPINLHQQFSFLPLLSSLTIFHVQSNQSCKLLFSMK